ncbi:MAG: hypothetical protein WA581_03230 [Candidatus Acidiferrales bacterium]
MKRYPSDVTEYEVAYLNRSMFEEKAELSYEDLRAIAQDFIRASYDYQKKLYGKVKVKISVAKLLRSR